MATYVPTNWKTGDVITATKLNNMETGIADASALANGALQTSGGTVNGTLQVNNGVSFFIQNEVAAGRSGFIGYNAVARPSARRIFSYFEDEESAQSFDISKMQGGILFLTDNSGNLEQININVNTSNPGDNYSSSFGLSISEDNLVWKGKRILTTDDLSSV